MMQENNLDYYRRLCDNLSRESFSLKEDILLLKSELSAANARIAGMDIELNDINNKFLSANAHAEDMEIISLELEEYSNYLKSSISESEKQQPVGYGCAELRSIIPIHICNSESEKLGLEFNPKESHFFRPVYDKPFPAQEVKLQCKMGVGDGSGNLFVHGDYESIKAMQNIVIERDDLRVKARSIKQKITKQDAREIINSYMKLSIPFKITFESWASAEGRALLAKLNGEKL